MQGGSGGSQLQSLSAHSVSGSAAVIGIAETRSSATFAPIVAQAGLATVLAGDVARSPIVGSNVTLASASDSSTGQYEVAGASVTVGGIAAPVVALSPSQITFFIPPSVPQGEAEVIITSQDGYVSRGTVTVAAIAPGIFTTSNTGTGEAVAVNTFISMRGAFSTTTANNPTSDKRTRVTLLTSGVGGIETAGMNTGTQTRMQNFAHGVACEARTRDGRVRQLAVEFSGANGRFIGVEQIQIVLEDDLRGAGTVELTIITRGQRSNIATIEVR